VLVLAWSTESAAWAVLTAEQWAWARAKASAGNSLAIRRLRAEVSALQAAVAAKQNTPPQSLQLLQSGLPKNLGEPSNGASLSP
jgi:hypothetical protein